MTFWWGSSCTTSWDWKHDDSVGDAWRSLAVFLVFLHILQHDLALIFVGCPCRATWHEICNNYTAFVFLPSCVFLYYSSMLPGIYHWDPVQDKKIEDKSFICTRVRRGTLEFFSLPPAHHALHSFFFFLGGGGVTAAQVILVNSLTQGPTDMWHVCWGRGSNQQPSDHVHKDIIHWATYCLTAR